MAKKKSSTQSTTSERIPVLIEMRTGGLEAADTSMAAGMDVAGFTIDTDYEPVPMERGSSVDTFDGAESAGLNGNAATGDVGDERVVMMRGFVDDESQIATLEAQPNVVAVWPDRPVLQPFESAILDAPVATSTGDEPTIAVTDLPEADEIDLVANNAFGSCPIGTCDCTPATPKATIAQVRNYLGVNQIHAQGIRGQGMVVAIMDGGIMAKGKVAGGDIENVIGGFPANWGKVAGWNKHAHMCATDVQGMAPDVKLYDIRISDGNFVSAALAGFQWAINQHKANGTPHVINCSFGIFQKSWDPAYATNPNHPLTRKVVEAINEGILVLFAAGNCGGTCPDGRCTMNGINDTGPGKSIWGANGHPRSITVGAVNINEQFVGYSSQGPAALDPQKPDFVSVTHFTGYFNSDSGTSAATPIAAGVVALLKQANSGFTQEQIKQLLKNTAKDLGPAGWDQHTGAGVIRPKVAFDTVQRWHANKKVIRTYSTYQSKAAWAYMEDLGWRRVDPSTADGVTNMFTMLCQAQVSGKVLTILADGSKLYRMYA